mgnify:FL=1|tara:strand:- start:255 stop:509 length:255 start_codon:yes stop_codon:yes gene_type:complete
MIKKLNNDVNESIEQHNLRLAEEESLRRREEQSFKKIFTHKFLGPLSIGLIVAFAGMLFENDPIIYIGTGIHMFGWFLWIKELF